MPERRRQPGLTFPEDPSEEELARGWTLSEDDRTEVLPCRGDDNRRRFALQLCVLKPVILFRTCRFDEGDLAMGSGSYSGARSRRFGHGQKWPISGEPCHTSIRPPLEGEMVLAGLVEEWG